MSCRLPSSASHNHRFVLNGAKWSAVQISQHQSKQLKFLSQSQWKKSINSSPNCSPVNESKRNDTNLVLQTSKLVPSNNLKMDQESNCFICRQSLLSNSPEKFTELTEGSVFQFLCDLFNISSLCFSTTSNLNKLKNAYFCDDCEVDIRKLMVSVELIRSIEKEVQNLKVKLTKTIESSLEQTDKSTDLDLTSGNANETLRKMFAQCITDCKVVIPKLDPSGQQSQSQENAEDDQESYDEILTPIITMEVPQDLKEEVSSGSSPPSSPPAPKRKRGRPRKSNLRVPPVKVHAKKSKSVAKKRRKMKVEFKPESAAEEDEFKDPEASKVARKKRLRKPPPESFPCDRCTGVFKMKKELDHHLLETHDFDVKLHCRHCKANYNSCLIDPAEPTGMLYRCTLDSCKMCTFRTLDEFKMHHRKFCPSNPRVIRNKTNQICNFCGKVLSSSLTLQYHIKNLHEKDFKFCCETCGRGFQTNSTLQHHLRIVHAKTFQCTTCQKLFKQRCSLNRHIRTHTGEKPFVCELCGKSFHDKSLLKVHMDNIHSDKQLPCVLCGKTFKSVNYLQNHMASVHRRGYTIYDKAEAPNTVPPPVQQELQNAEVF